MALLGALALPLATAACGRAAPDPQPAPAASPRGRVDSIQLRAPGLTISDRRIHIYTPPGYAASTARYPVLYLHDGQNMFTPGMFGDWLVDETLDAMVARGQMRGMIIVGIDNSARRWDEYSPWVNINMNAWFDPRYTAPTQGGEGDAYIEFIVTTLKPEIDRRYRTLADRDHTGIGGSSMGGLISVYAGYVHPDVFSKVMAMSSAVWFAERGGAWLSDNQLVSYLRGRRPPSDVRFYLDVGTTERSRDTEPDVLDRQGQPVTYSRAYLEGVEAVAAALRDAGVTEARLRVRVDSGAVHNESAWARRFGDAVLWLYR
jgi:predicted alpha/beta superfamily hydrolase